MIKVASQVNGRKLDLRMNGIETGGWPFEKRLNKICTLHYI